MDKKEDAWKHLYELKVLFIDEFFKIQEDPTMRKSFNVIKSLLFGKIQKSLGESSSEPKHDKHSDKEKSSKHDKHEKHEKQEKHEKHDKHDKKSHSKKQQGKSS